jgi:flagellin-like protein
MARKLLKSKKAISPILATLLLIVIAVAAVVVTYAWVMTYTSSASSQAGVLLKKDAVNWQSSKIVIYVRNTGTSDATIDAVYIGEGSTNYVLQTSVSYDPTSKVVSKDGGIITITVTYNWTSQTTYYFRIVPKLGEALVFQEKAP